MVLSEDFFLFVTSCMYFFNLKLHVTPDKRPIKVAVPENSTTKHYVLIYHAQVISTSTSKNGTAQTEGVATNRKEAPKNKQAGKTHQAKQRKG